MHYLGTKEFAYRQFSASKWLLLFLLQALKIGWSKTGWGKGL